ncbi:MAG: 50S ribosomal protein L7/L12 [Oscillospiraceae bacterium]|jgi:large subunit ribosomal protein L7/L12|nr:50S ribosomal protein L7/L12 [Oscillospiraceae bacterium]
MSASNLQGIIDSLKSLTVIELSELVKALEEEFGVSAAAPVAVAAPAADASAGGAAAEEKTEFDVFLNSVPEKKAPVIKVVKEILAVGMMEAKRIVEDAPTAIKEAVSKEDAESFKAKLIEAGADAVIK